MAYFYHCYRQTNALQRYLLMNGGVRDKCLESIQSSQIICIQMELCDFTLTQFKKKNVLNSMDTLMS